MLPIAITGMACRFPGAPDLHDYWRLIHRGTVVGGPVGGRWDHEPFHRPQDPRDPDGSYTDRVAHLDDVRSFAALHYGLPPRRVEVTDPQHRLLIELTRVALQDAGLERGPFPRERTGVYVGASVTEYKDMLTSRIRARQLARGQFGSVDAADADRLTAAADGVAPTNAYTVPGTLLNMAATSVSSVFDLGGPSFVVDSACSASLAAVHEAVTHLRSGQCEVALAGGVYLNLVPDNLIGFSRIGVVSRTGVCRPFDRRADGFVLGEGAGMAVLKRLADAERDGDRVYAVIRGSACTNDGRSSGPMTPSEKGQTACLERAYDDAGVPPGSVGFIECHGAATPTGDAVEMASLRALRSGTPAGPPAYVSSVKANIGHTLSAAGIAGLLKAALVVHHGVVPPQAGCEQAEPGLLPNGGTFAVTREPRAWRPERDAPRRAGVSAFGFGGTNVHMVLEQAPEPSPGPAVAVTRGADGLLFLLTAGSDALLAQYAERLADTLGEPESPSPTLADVAYTLASRTPLRARAVVAAATRAELSRRLGELASALRDDAAVPPGVWVRCPGIHPRGPGGAPPPEAEHLLGSPQPHPRRPSVAAPGRLVNLPPSPVETSTYWALDEPEHTTTPDGSVTARLLAAVARVSDFPPDVLEPDQTLVDDLGFDSLLTAELTAQLDNEWPGLPPLTRELLRPGTTVREIADWITAHAPRFVPGQTPAPPAEKLPHSDGPTGPTAATGLADHLRQLGLPSPYFAVHDELIGATALVDGVRLTNFSGYDYLGLTRDPVVTTAAKAAIDRYGTSVSASRAASGERPVHGLLEEALARHLNAERALALVGGHPTNVAVLAHLLGPADLIVHDAFAHNSILQGAQLSGARRRIFPHNDMAVLDRLLTEQRPRHQRVVVAVEGVYSMDGDLADLPALIELRRRHDVLLYLDEAHSIGVLGATGAGAAEHWGVPGDEVDIRMGTLSKALASCGGYVAGAEPLITHLRHTTPGFLYSVGIPPSAAAAALAALERLRQDPALAATARARAARFRQGALAAGLNTGLSTDGSCVVPVITGDADTALRLADRMRQHGVNVQPFTPPAVENHQSRLRFFVTADHSEREIDATVRALTAAWAALQGEGALTI
ncbi:aminotransferase class I/II-fold pyridoxal phosphate-dependent enzyme [Streptomyces sp. NPDC091292]|uniref:aminotransferase class I/II-fold pyridoxal phosphate-dependent enzyme n=1 Tax=Streptomyces sp. NPDC091292 TaxID=3365991 RepID=UPI0037F9F6DA